MSYHTFLFDIDGTLTDSAPAILAALQRLLREETGKDYSPEDLEFILGLPNTELGAYFNIKNWDEILRKGQHYYNLYAPSITYFDGIEETVKELKSRGAKLGIVTSKTNAQYEGGFGQQPLAEYFDYAVCADDTAFFKPHPAPLLAAVHRLKSTAHETLFIGDSKNDMICARAAGIDGALALWGCRHPDGIDSRHRLALPSELLSLCRFRE